MTAAVTVMNHPTDQTLAAFVDGTLPTPERQEVIKHMAECAECRDVVLLTTEIKAAETPAPAKVAASAVLPWRPKVWVPLAAAAAIAVVVVMPQTRERIGFGPMRSAKAIVATAAKRPSEARVSLDIPYKEAKARLRGGNDENSQELTALTIEAEAADAQERAERNPTVSNLHAAGVLLMFDGKHDQAIVQLERAVKTAETPSAALLNDLSAAYFGRDNYQKALENAESAWKIEPTPTAAWNRAIALQLLRRNDDAIDAWQKYLELDPQSEWADEARGRKRDLQYLQQLR
jgi:tetratricopeptide (TPR) repeat protein